MSSNQICDVFAEYIDIILTEPKFQLEGGLTFINTKLERIREWFNEGVYKVQEK